jgi:hypothetical protein
VTSGVVFLGPFLFQKRLGPAVANLLFPVSPNPLSTMMPNHRAGIEAYLKARLLNPPADVHIISGHAELRIKSSDELQYTFAKRHVAAWNVLRIAVGDENMRRSTW